MKPFSSVALGGELPTPTPTPTHAGESRLVGMFVAVKSAFVEL